MQLITLGAAPRAASNFPRGRSCATWFTTARLCSIVNLKQCGSHIYARDASTDVWCVSYCIVTDGKRGPITTWLPTDPIPADIVAAAPDVLSVAFNDSFDRQIEQQNPRPPLWLAHLRH